jgi:ABC-type lipoprotein export system ATPase subunit
VAVPVAERAAPLVRLEAVSRHYGEVAPVVALRVVDLEIHAGEWVAVVGASGSGKTTLLNIVGCLDRQSSGTYRLDGVDVAALSDRERAGLRSHRIGFIFQSFHLLSYRTVVENVMLAEVYGRRPRAGRADRALAALAAVGLADRADALPTRLSGGERQRVAIARAIMHDPELLLCDEPTGNLDSVTTAGILDLLAGLYQAGLTIVVITHDAQVAQRAGRQVRIVDGRVSEQLGGAP